MKLTKYIIIAILFYGITSCNYLDFDESTGESKDYWYSYFNTTKRLLTYPYSLLYQDFGVVDDAILACATDDAEYVYSNSNIQSFNNGSWSAINTLDARWAESYEAIRSLNDFIKTFKETDYTRFENNISYKRDSLEIQSFPYEARILRAKYLFDLAKRYGDIPMPLDVLEIEEANTISPTPFNEVIDFIVAECDTGAQNLPIDYNVEINGETGRMTKGSAMALKSRALLYAASPLHNPENKTDKWELAAQSSLDLINEGIYNLEPDISTQLTNNIQSSEIIMTRRNGDDNKFERINFSIGFEGGNTGACPTQNLVDAFQTINGYDVTLTENGWQCDDPLFDPANPYINRDPRLYKAVLFNGAPFKGRLIETYRGGLDGSPIQGATVTGYYLMKYLEEDVDLTPGINTQAKHHWIVFRYAEIILNYAEAMNEAFGPSYQDENFTLTATDALNMLRNRANMPEVSETTQDEFRTLVRQEKRVEMAFEGHRFWDVRRWKIGPQTQTSISGVEIIKGEFGDYVYSKKLIENRIWDEKMNLFPIPQQEIYINNNLEQNEKW